MISVCQSIIKTFVKQMRGFEIHTRFSLDDAIDQSEAPKISTKSLLGRFFPNWLKLAANGAYGVLSIVMTAEWFSYSCICFLKVFRYMFLAHIQV